VAFNEEIQQQDEQDAQTHDLVPEKEDNSKQKKVKEKQAIRRKHSDNRAASPSCKDGHDSAPHGEDNSGGKHVVEGSSSGTLANEGIPGGMSAAAEDWDDYKCFIVEEPPPSDT